MNQDLNERKLAAAMAAYAWREDSVRPLTERQAAMARQLIGCGFAEALPSSDQFCSVMVELRRLLAGPCRYYVSPDGEVFIGDTLAKSKRIEL